VKSEDPVTIPGQHYQACFARRWGHLQHPDVRSLAWLLDSPLLLNPQHPRWNARLAQLPVPDLATAAWLEQLDLAPQDLLEFLAIHPHTRLGHYAENLLAFYFSWRNQLVAHGVQVRSHTTIGEFDFLLDTPDGFEHWEFACKFYLLTEPATRLADFVGPNLMDNLNDKSHKIMDAQLALGQHHDAQKYLPKPLQGAKALLKGWLFYPQLDSATLPEVQPSHCRGLWCRLSDLEALVEQRCTVLSRLAWLAPARVATAHTVSAADLSAMLQRQFVVDARPVLVASLTACDDYFIEDQRIFVVPDSWNRTGHP